MLYAFSGIAAVASFVAGTCLAQPLGRPLEFERVEIQAAPEFDDVFDATPYYKFVTSDAMLVGAFDQPGANDMLFRQRFDGTGFELAGQMELNSANSLGIAVGRSRGVSGKVGSISYPGQGVVHLENTAFSSSLLNGVSESGLAVGQALLTGANSNSPITWDGSDVTVLPLPIDATGGRALGISPDGHTVVGLVDTNDLDIHDRRIRRVVTWVDGMLEETGITQSDSSEVFPLEVSDEGILLHHINLAGEPRATVIYDLVLGERLYVDVYPDNVNIINAVGIGSDGTIPVFGAYGSSPDFEPAGFLGPHGFTLLDDAVPSRPLGVSFTDWELSSTFLLAREFDGPSWTDVVYRRVPAPGTASLIAAAFTVASRRKRAE